MSKSKIYQFNTDYDYLLKILLIGDSGVGKSSVMIRYSDDQYDDSSIPTIGVDFKIKTTEINGKKCKLQIWDTAGQERFRTITSSYYRGANGIIIVYDISNENTFKNISYWISECQSYTSPNTKILLVGNKCDASSKSNITIVERSEISKPYRQVHYEDALTFAKSHGIKYVETSAKNGNGIEQAFNELIEEILDTNSVSLINPMKMNNQPNQTNQTKLSSIRVQKQTQKCC